LARATVPAWSAAGIRVASALDVPSAQRTALHVSPRRLAVAGGAWAVLTLGAILLAVALDSPVGAGARDEARPVAPGGAAVAEAPGAGADGGEAGLPPAALPPLALVTDRPAPADIAGLPPEEQVRHLSARADGATDPTAWVELGVLQQQLGAPEDAAAAYRAALRVRPGHLPALTGLAMSEGASGAGLAAAAEELGRLAAAHPDSALVAMNLGWVELYRGRPQATRAALERAVALGGDSRVGRIARALVEALDQGALGARP